MTEIDDTHCPYCKRYDPYWRCRCDEVVGCGHLHTSVCSGCGCCRICAGCHCAED